MYPVSRRLLIYLLFAVFLRAAPRANAIYVETPATKLFTVQGQVVGGTWDGAHVPLPGATVLLLSADDLLASAPVASTTTDANGCFAFPRVTRGRYRLKASLEGFVPHSVPIKVIRFSLRRSRSIVLGLNITVTTGSNGFVEVVPLNSCPGAQRPVVQ